MNEMKKKSTLGSILVMLALIVVLFGGVKLIFWVVERSVGSVGESIYVPIPQENGRSSPYGLRFLEEGERAQSDLVLWMDRVRDQMEEDTVYWLYRQMQDDYILYLPREDRTLTEQDLTADEKRQEDGEMTLVLKVRTPEEGAEVEPEDQLLCIKTTSEKWRGIRVRVVLDGREQTVEKLVSTGPELNSVEEVYIGRF